MSVRQAAANRAKEAYRLVMTHAVITKGLSRTPDGDRWRWIDPNTSFIIHLNSNGKVVV